jgi:hypothetical protein
MSRDFYRHWDRIRAEGRDEYRPVPWADYLLGIALFALALGTLFLWLAVGGAQ